MGWLIEISIVLSIGGVVFVRLIIHFQKVLHYGNIDRLMKTAYALKQDLTITKQAITELQEIYQSDSEIESFPGVGICSKKMKLKLLSKSKAKVKTVE